MLSAIFTLLASTLIFSALLTPFAYEAMLYFVGDLWPYSRVFDRVAMLVCGVAIYLLRDRFKLDALREAWRADAQRRVRGVLSGFITSLLGSLLVLAILIDGDPLDWNLIEPQKLLWKILKVIPAALLISVIEEGFFRVLLFGNLRKRSPLLVALTISCLLYGVAHFIVPFKGYQYPGLSWSVGFEYLAEVGARMATLSDLPAFLGLFIVGATLCLLINYTNSLALCIGLHTGWIVALKFSLYVTVSAPGYDFGSGVGRRYFLVADPLSWVMVICVGALAFYLFRQQSRGPS